MLAPTKLSTTVHIMEVRELAITTAAGLCDPFVRVSVAGRFQRQTAIKHGMTSAVFDDRFSFPEVVLSPDEYDRAMIRIEVFTANTFSRNELIGQFAFSMNKVRSQVTHEFYQTWVVLMNPAFPGAGQGFLRVSVTVLGPGDIPPSHSHAEIVEDYTSFEALKQATRFGAEARNVVGAPNTEKRRGYDFTVKVFRAEHLEVEADTFVAVKFNGVIAITPVKKRSKAPDWNYRLNLPIFTPLYSDVVEVELWQKGSGLTRDALVATVFLKFSEIVLDLIPPTWYNFYGVPPEETGLSQWWTDLVRKGKLQATGYLGRVLLSAQATLTESPTKDERPCTPANGGPTTRYAVWIDVIRGSELPVSMGTQLMVETRLGPRENTRRSDWCTSKMVNGELVYDFTCSGQYAPVEGDYNIAQAPEEQEGAEENAGVSTRICRFRPLDLILQDVEPTDEPRKTGQLFDLVVSVYSRNLFGQESRLGFVRIKPVDTWGFKNDAEYHALKGYVEDATGFSKSQGFILMSVQFGKYEDRPEKPRDDPARLLNDFQLYEVRAYVYQARHLPPVDASGLASTYVTVSVAGRSGRLAHTQPSRVKEFSSGVLHRTTTAKDTLHPVWYETLLLEKVELPSKLSLAPDIEVKVFAEGKPDYIGRARFPVELATTRYWPRKARARWLKLVKFDATQMRMDKRTQTASSALAQATSSQTSALPAGDYEAGDLLIKLEVMPLAKAMRKPWYARHEWPEVQRVGVIVSTIGLRSLVSGQGVKGDVENPVVQLAVASLPDTRGLLAKARQKAASRMGGAEESAGEPESDTDSDEALSLTGAEETWDPSQVRRDVLPAATVEQRQAHVVKFILDLMNDPTAAKGDGVVTWSSTSKASALAADEEQGGQGDGVKDRLFDLLPGEPGSTFMSYVVLPVNFPVDPFYAPAMTVRVFAGASGGGGGWFSSAPAVLGSAVVPLRQFAEALYGEQSQRSKLVDAVFQLPKLALTREGKDQFEAIARRDSLNTASTQSLPAGGADDAGIDGDPMSSAAALAAASASGVDTSKMQQGAEDASQVTERTDSHDELSDHTLHGEGEELPFKVTLDPEELNLAFDFEITKLEETIRPTADDKTEATGLMGEVANKFSGVHWPGELSGNDSLQGCVADELEVSSYMHPLPYAAITLYRGSRVEASLASVGVFKAGILVSKDAPASDVALEHDSKAIAPSMIHPGLAALYTSPSPATGEDAKVPPITRLVREGPQNIKVRVYVVQGTDLWSRAPESAQPFLTLNMSVPKRAKRAGFEGVASISDEVNFKQGVSPMFGSWYELDARFPDVSELEIQVWDKRALGNDLVGSTKVDLEDRWFNPLWQGMKATRRFMREFRPLYVQGDPCPRGKLEMWIELYSLHEAIEAKITDIRAPKTSEWELRVAVWETRGVPPMEDQTSISLYITGELSFKKDDGLWSPEQLQSTDTHYYIKNGNGLFNWRFKFNFASPCRYPRLTIKVWSTEWLSLQPNQAAGIAVIDLDFLVAIAQSTAGDEPIERPRTLVKLTQEGGVSRGEVDLQMSLVRMKRALEDPVGAGREPPNKDPFLPEPKRDPFTWGGLLKGFSFYRVFCCFLCLGVIAAVLAIIFTTVI